MSHKTKSHINSHCSLVLANHQKKACPHTITEITPHKLHVTWKSHHTKFPCLVCTESSRTFLTLVTVGIKRSNFIWDAILLKKRFYMRCKSIYKQEHTHTHKATEMTTKKQCFKERPPKGLIVVWLNFILMWLRFVCTQIAYEILFYMKLNKMWECFK